MTTRSLSHRAALAFVPFLLSAAPAVAVASDGDEFELPRRLREYFEEMSATAPFLVRTGEEWGARRDELRDFLMESVGLRPLPERIPLDVHRSAPLDHPWCTIRRIAYRLWPDIWSTGLLYLPKSLPEEPAPAVLCPHGHWDDGNAHPTVQTRCLNLARKGYVTFSTEQLHFEDPYVGVSHQTVMIWNNMRALDFLESLEVVDAKRIGVAGASGGGLQTQMLVALDQRVTAATIVGLTCQLRRIMFPDGNHCDCNHFPGIMKRTDFPEISALGLPRPVQYLVMDDWTQRFETESFPTIQKLYGANGHGEKVACRYFATLHDYDPPKREYTYWWMDRWLRGSVQSEPEPEPETTPFPVATIQGLAVERPKSEGLAALSRIYREERRRPTPELSTVAEWREFRARECDRLRELLGNDAELPRREEFVLLGGEMAGDIIVERGGFPSEGSILVSTLLVRPVEHEVGELSVEVILGERGKEALLALSGDDSPRSRVRRGALVVLPDLRTFGESFSTGTTDSEAQAHAWERNGILWGRPVAGMAVTDLRAVLDGVATRYELDAMRVTVSTRGSGDLAAAGLFATILDRRIVAADLDFAEELRSRYGTR